MPKSINYGQDKVTRNGMYIFPKGEELSGNEIIGFINHNESVLGKKYRRNMNLYLGHHKILNEPSRDNGADNRIVVNMPKYLVDTYNGFFIGIPPTITLDSDKQDQTLQDWNDREQIFDKLNELSKQSDIYGRSYMYIFQDEDSETRVAVSSPSHSFMIYDDTVMRNPIAFVRYEIPDRGTISDATGIIQYADKFYKFSGENIEPDTDANSYGKNPYGIVPAIEFFENEERQGVFDSAVSLINELDKATSQKANQVEYFDNAYLAMIGVQLDEKQLDDNGIPKIDMKKQRFLYLPNVDPNSPNPRIEFVAKPDADQMQENLIDRINNWIFQMSMVPNLNDEAFAGNSSGVALNFKLLPMRNRASNKERKYTQALKNMYRIIFSIIKGFDKDSWSKLKFNFTRNLPANIAEEVENAKNAEGLVSKETQLTLMGDVIPDNPKAEIDRLNKEREKNIQMAIKNSPSTTDFDMNNGDDNENTTRSKK